MTDHPNDPSNPSDDPSNPSNPVADETLRLVSSIQDWARRTFPQDPDHPPSECQWCPLCQFAAVLRGERPEVTARVAEAGTAVVSALRALLDAAADASNGAHASNGAGQHRHAGGVRPSAARPRVQRINLSDEV
ncbi:MAG: hypothetical protein QOK12_985 [Mycobacterium sp.]|nr:hypothetical protein [Mycobacterium sp.]